MLTLSLFICAIGLFVIVIVLRKEHYRKQEMARRQKAKEERERQARFSQPCHIPVWVTKPYPYLTDEDLKK